MSQKTHFRSDQPTRILIVDDHPLVRGGLAARIAQQPDMEVCGEAASVDEAMQQVHATHPDLAIIDIALADSNGIDLVQRLRSQHPQIKMLVVSAYEESLYAERSLRAGAHGYVNKRAMQENIFEALRTVMEGQRYLSPKMTQYLLSQAMSPLSSGETHPVQRLSNRELQVFQLIGEGKTTGAIAAGLHLSVHTIDTHREKIRHKLRLKNGAELMQRAVQWALENK